MVLHENTCSTRMRASGQSHEDNPMPANAQIDRSARSETKNTKAAGSKVNITLKLDKDLVRKVRVLAAEKGTSVSALLASKLEEELSRRAAYEKAKESALKFMKKGINLGGRPLTREEMHERR
jgi:predicted transcriptional regulator